MTTSSSMSVKPPPSTPRASPRSRAQSRGGNKVFIFTYPAFTRLVRNHAAAENPRPNTPNKSTLRHFVRAVLRFPEFLSNSQEKISDGSIFVSIQPFASTYTIQQNRHLTSPRIPTRITEHRLGGLASAWHSNLSGRPSGPHLARPCAVPSPLLVSGFARGLSFVQLRLPTL